MKCLLVGLALGTGVLMAAEPSVRPSALQVVWEDDKENSGGFGAINSMNPIELTRLLDTGGKKLIELDTRGSKVTAFKDGEGTNLKGEVGPFPKVSEDKLMARFSERGGKAPVAGAGTISAEGVVKARVGSKVDTKTSKVVKADKGEKVTVTKEYKLAKKVSEFRVEMDLWTDMEELEVPFDVTAAIGGAK